MEPISKQSRTCPCKFIPKSLSSFTAAEYGDIHSLCKVKNVTTRKDDSGYNPLHFAAQFNHVAATVYLLQMGCPVDGGGHCGATPLHRAAFSGATAAMKILLEWNVPRNTDHQTGTCDTGVTSFNGTTKLPSSKTISESNFCDLLARDTSFGDESTPLHKAAAGGRYLAVKMILEALKERDTIFAKRMERITHESSQMQETSWLERGLTAKDKYDRTPLNVAYHLFETRDTERDAVARWDTVSGGSADWGKCVCLLENTAKSISLQNGKVESKIMNKQTAKSDYFSKSSSIRNRNIRSIPWMPLQLTNHTMACFDCNPVSGGNIDICLISSWQAKFEKALGKSASLDITANNATCHPVANGTISLEIVATTLHKETTTKKKNKTYEKTRNPKEEASTIHSICTNCRKPTIAFYRLPKTGTLVCKRCKFSANKKGRTIVSMVIN